jgi:Sec-independent protein translocase protein TatA
MKETDAAHPIFSGNSSSLPQERLREAARSFGSSVIGYRNILAENREKAKKSFKPRSTHSERKTQEASLSV